VAKNHQPDHIPHRGFFPIFRPVEIAIECCDMLWPRRGPSDQDFFSEEGSKVCYEAYLLLVYSQSSGSNVIYLLTRLLMHRLFRCSWIPRNGSQRQT
jgi:hypothetical protein